MTTARFYRFLDGALDRVFYRLGELDWDTLDLAKKSGLSIRTIRNLDERITRQPRLSTVVKVARAVGMELDLRDVCRRNVA